MKYGALIIFEESRLKQIISVQFIALYSSVSYRLLDSIVGPAQ